MVILRPGKARESTMVTAEDYKRHVRAYMESFGFAQTTDALTEGHLADMVFVPLDDRTSRPEHWVETKAQDVGLKDEDFVKELKSYLAQYLIRRPEARFQLWIFVKKLRNPERWREVFDDKITEETVAAWLRDTAAASDAEEERIGSADLSRDIVSFFSETRVVDGDADVLDAAVQARARSGSSLMGSQKRARAILEAMEKRSRPLAAHSTLFGNLIQLRPPQRYVELMIEPKTLDEIKDVFKGQPRPPFGVIEKDSLLAVATDSVETDFAPVRGKIAKTLNLSEVESLYEDQLIALLNRGVDSLIGRHGVGRSEHSYYFRATDEVAKGRARTIGPYHKRLTVATPKYKNDAGEEVEDEVEYFGSLRKKMLGTRTRHLNYVFHEGFEAGVRRLWGSYFVFLRLHRAYTSDGGKALDGESSARLDESFRTPKYNRADTQSRKLDIISTELFHQRGTFRPLPPWAQNFGFGGFLRLPIEWEPERVDLRDSLLFEPEEKRTEGRDHDA